MSKTKKAATKTAAKTMQKSLKWMIGLLIVVLLICAALGGVWIKKKLDERAARQAAYEAAQNEKAEEITLTFLPGNTIFSVKKMLLEKGYAAEAVEAALARQYPATIALGQPAEVTGVGGAKVATSVEGFLLPETINFYATDSAETVIGRMTTELQQAAEREQLAAAFRTQGLSFYVGLTLASIVQQEAALADAPAVAAIFYNRLAAGMTLGADATTLYAANLAGVPTQNEDGSPNTAILNLDSPWNTRRVAGLPPTPISSPTLEILKVTANPDRVNYQGYYYFLTGDDGQLYVARDLAGHNQNIANHCRERCANW